MIDNLDAAKIHAFALRGVADTVFVAEQRDSCNAALGAGSGGASAPTYGLRRGGTVGESVPDSDPSGGLHRRHEAVLTARVSAVWNAFEDLDIAGNGAAHFAVRRFGDRVGGIGAEREPLERAGLSGGQQRGGLSEETSSVQ